MKPINLKLVEVETDDCTGCYYLNEPFTCTNQNHPYGEMDCINVDGVIGCYIFEEDEKALMNDVMEEELKLHNKAYMKLVEGARMNIKQLKECIANIPDDYDFVVRTIEGDIWNFNVDEACYSEFKGEFYLETKDYIR